MSTHERSIPGLSALSPIVNPEQCYSALSFCLPTSLAFAKRLTWEQTPWIPHTFNYKSVNPIDEADAHRIATYLSLHGHSVTARDVQCALLFGSTTPSQNKMTEGIGSCPHLFVIFPHATMVPSIDPEFLKVWHDDIVKPAFDTAWKDSGLALVSGASLDTPTRVLPPTGIRTSRDAFPASGFLERLRHAKSGAVRDYWPSWKDDSWYLGLEGKHTGKRTTIYDAAWDAIKGMLKDHPQLSSYQHPMYQEPILLAVSRGVVHVNPRLSTKDKYRYVAQEWDRLVDSRFVKQGSFQAVFETVVGNTPEPEEYSEGEEMLMDEELLDEDEVKKIREKEEVLKREEKLANEKMEADEPVVTVGPVETTLAVEGNSEGIKRKEDFTIPTSEDEYRNKRRRRE
ncbi:uncharacterized protein J4E84_000093 [Alternaria hordeiaustralica]|uniref:uncharacterized protein n=1 Tax=Alternaria hordeiaustralica TaxID=1187925 RepID=UPI0020C2D38B|nr:uncharacterized protein J4E84_000093 [Alternaria hordeiaustralica]KAI4696969.1 hypothetical protein J4E84_000093 [Alternaria hordeiaustralica]